MRKDHNNTKKSEWKENQRHLNQTGTVQLIWTTWKLKEFETNFENICVVEHGVKLENRIWRSTGERGV